MKSKILKFTLLCALTLFAIAIACVYYLPPLPNILNQKNSEIKSVLSYDIVDINNTDYEKLPLLYGVSEDEAITIYYLRLRLRGYTSLEELYNIEGISEYDVKMWGERVILTPFK